MLSMTQRHHVKNDNPLKNNPINEKGRYNTTYRKYNFTYYCSWSLNEKAAES